MGPLTILGAGIAIVLVAVLVFRLHPFLALIFAAAAVATFTPQTQIERYATKQVEKGKWTDGASEKFIDSTVMERVATAFGETCGKVGILIAMAAVIGKCLLDSGSAERIVRSFVHVLGQAQASLGFIFSGFLLGIPVFFDTVFYLMIPLGKAMRLRTGGNYLLYILSIMAGATMAHSLVPPTPGPLFVADRLGVNLGLMIGVGILVGIVASMGGFAFALLANR